MEFKLYKTTEDYNYDEMYEFIPLGNSKSEYLTQITIDWLDIDLEERGKVIRVSCNCQDFERRRHFCKHIIQCIKILSKDKKFNMESNMKRYWCSICKKHCDSIGEVPKCYNCENDMLESRKNENNKEKII